MFEQTSRLAEKLASSVSRRRFLGSLGGWAAAAALGVAGVLTAAGTARAAQKYLCCFYFSNGFSPVCYKCVSASLGFCGPCGFLSPHSPVESGNCHCSKPYGDVPACTSQ